jgi:FtsP/CotA-like multicopper oxidase with cupredoxin domain
MAAVSWAQTNAYLRAEVFTQTLPDGTAVTMWGYSECNAAYTTCGAPSSPGPTLTATAGETLNIQVRNALTGVYTEPTSLIIPGQIATLTPTWSDGSTGARPAGNTALRVRSFTSEAAVGGTTTYSWTGIKAGTFLYQSGTHPSVQVQMGLFGVLRVNPATPGQAYDPASTAYDNQINLVFSEIDPALHGAIAAGTYGPGRTVTSTIGYAPKYFLINGQPFSYASSAINAGTAVAGQRILIRFLNAGYEPHVPVFQGANLTVLAEDGNLYPYPKRQYSVLLPPGKTTDAILTVSAPTAPNYIAFQDRMLNLTNSSASPGGMMGYLKLATTNQYSLTVTKTGKGAASGTVNAASLPAGISCGTDCTEAYNENTEVKLAAAPARGFAVVWSGGGCTGQSDCVATMTADTTINAAFNRIGWIGVFRNGGWFLDTNGNGTWDGCETDGCFSSFGFPTDIPVTGDWTGTSVSRFGVFRNGEWYLDLNGSGGWDGCGTDGCYASFGMTGDIPVTGDWTGTGITRIGVFRNGEWYLDLNGNGAWDGCGTDGCYPSFGMAGDKPVTGDWNGNGLTKIGVFRNGQWFLDLNGNGAWDGCGTDACYASFGMAGDTPIIGGW